MSKTALHVWIAICLVGLAWPGGARAQSVSEPVGSTPAICALDRQRVEPAPVVEASAERRAQCERHVASLRRGMAMQVVATARESEAERSPARDCLVEGASPLESCLHTDELAQLDGLSRQRVVDCGGWPEALAACILDGGASPFTSLR
jgi:hypothetical protein